MRTQGPNKASPCYNPLCSYLENVEDTGNPHYIQFSSHTGIQAVPPKACGHVAGLSLNSGHRFQSGRKASKESAGSLPPAEPPLCGPPPSHVRRAASWGRGCPGHSCASLGPRAVSAVRHRQLARYCHWDPPAQPHTLTLYRHQECGFPSECTRWHLPTPSSNG